MPSHLFTFSVVLLMSACTLSAQLPPADGYLPAAPNATAAKTNSVQVDSSTMTRSAPLGNSNIAAGKQQEESVQIKSLPLAYQQGASPYQSSNQQQQQQQAQPSPSQGNSQSASQSVPSGYAGPSPSASQSVPSGYPSSSASQSVPSPGATPYAGGPAQGAGYPPQDPVRGLAYLEYIAYLLQTYPHPQGPCKSAAGCDLSQFKGCTCVSPALYSPDGRGNCNLGVTKADTQVWCYVSEKAGRAVDLCPDARESTSRPGYYWSRIACITE